MSRKSQKSWFVVGSAVLQGICCFPQGKMVVFDGHFVVLRVVNVVS